MILYHWTPSGNVEKILSEGLKPKRSDWCNYLSPKPTGWMDFQQGEEKGETLLEVETGDIKLTAFEDCSQWEVLCWGEVLPENIKVYNDR